MRKLLLLFSVLLLGACAQPNSVAPPAFFESVQYPLPSSLIVPIEGKTLILDTANNTALFEGEVIQADLIDMSNEDGPNFYILEFNNNKYWLHYNGNNVDYILRIIQ